ncbi:MAG: hypothetical protein RSB23_07865 [Alistipes sp.]
MGTSFSMKFATLACVCGVLLSVACSNDEDPSDTPGTVCPEEAVNVSANGTANSYIVAPGSIAVFDASHKGNSTTETVGEGAEVRLVWQDTQGLIEKIGYTADRRIIVWTAAKSGNGVVAVADATGAILWSWHIWVVDYTPAASLFTTPANALGTTWSFMDRNLGALNTTPGSFDAFGMIYQWGRKDPLAPACEWTDMNDDYTYNVDGEKPLYDIDNKTLIKTRLKTEYHGTIAKSLMQPDVFFAMTYKHTGKLDEFGNEIVENDYRTKDWVDVSNDDYWGGVSGKKSIYDPCPTGYKVPTCDTGGNTPYAWLVFAKMTWDVANHGCTQDGQWFPTAGTRVYASGGLDCTGVYSGLWIGTAGKASSNLEEFPDLYGQYMFIINGKRTFKVSKDARSQGLSVRCVKE